MDFSFLLSRRRSDAHAGVVKHGCWRDLSVFATAGNDGLVCVFDARAQLPGPVATAGSRDSIAKSVQVVTGRDVLSAPPRFPTACVGGADRDSPALVCAAGLHRGYAVNTVAWSPLSPFILLSSSFDKNIALTDIRRPDRSLFRVDAHWGGAANKSSRATSIHHPCFVRNGALIAASSDLEPARLWLLSAATGAAVGEVALQSPPGREWCDLGGPPTAFSRFTERGTDRLALFAQRNLHVLSLD
jgi:WD40 repeat protein